MADSKNREKRLERKKEHESQLFKLEKTIGKTINEFQFEYGNLTILFTDNTYLELAGDNNGDGGYVYVVMPLRESQKQDDFKWFGNKCNKCHHQWLPRKLENSRKQCPRCKSIEITSIMNLLNTNNIE